MTFLITLERYLVISCPQRSLGWFTVSKTKMYILCVYVFALLMGLPRFLSLFVMENDISPDIPCLGNQKYLILATSMRDFWFHHMKTFYDKIDFWVLLPLLLFLNILLFLEVRKFAKRRKELNIKQIKEIKAVKMFVPVVIVLFVCNIEPFAHYYNIAVRGKIFREQYLADLLSITVNSSVNLPIYYFKGSSFKSHLKDLFSTCFLRLSCKDPKVDTSCVSSVTIGKTEHWLQCVFNNYFTES